MNRLTTASCCLAAAMAVGAASAETVAWYHFTEVVPGETTTDATVFENSANPGTMQARPSTSVRSVYNHLTGMNHWPTAMKLSSGAAGEVVENEQGRGFYMNSDVGVVEIADGLEAIAETIDGVSVEKSFTMEFFMKCLSRPVGTRSLLSRKNANGWWTFRTNNGALKFQASSDSTMGEVWTFQISSEANINKWHHYALTYDASTRTYAFYADYTRLASKQLPAKLAVGDAPILLGGLSGSYTENIGNKIKDGVLQVDLEMDEFRISDKVLTPAEFMGWRLAAADDVVVKMGLDDPAAAGLEMFAIPQVWNSAAHPTEKAAITVAADATVGLVGEKAVDTVHSGVRDAGTANAGALSLLGGTGNVSARLAVSDARFADSSFTVETFVKLNPQNYTFHSDSGYLFESSGSWYVRFMPSGAVQCSVGGEQLAWVNNVMDDQWHHLAFAYDKDTQTSTLYIDYVEKGSKVKSLPASGDGKLYVAGAHWNAQDGTFGEALLDEVRVTRTALRPWEFERADSVAGPTLLWADFETTIASEPQLAGLTASGVGEVAAEANSPSLQRNVPYAMTVAGDKSVVNARNQNSLRLLGDGYVWFRTPLVLVPELTVEMFVKNRSTSAAGLVALYDGNRVTDAIWGLELDADGKTLVFVEGIGASKVRHVFDGVTLDSRWHHLALVMKTPTTSLDAPSSVKLILDGKEVATTTLAVRIRQECTMPRVWLSRSTEGERFSGYLDELRISEGELTVDKMMMLKRSGLITIFR